MRRVWAAGLTALVMACAETPPPPPPAPAPLPVPAPVMEPVVSADVIESRRLRDAWIAAGMHAEVRSVQVSDKPADRIEWTGLDVELPLDPAHGNDVAAQVGGFAAGAARPVLIVLFARTHKQDTELSTALKKGLVARGGHNNVKLDHNIGVQFQPRFQVVLQGSQ